VFDQGDNLGDVLMILMMRVVFVLLMMYSMFPLLLLATVKYPANVWYYSVVWMILTHVGVIISVMMMKCVCDSIVMQLE